MTTDSSADNVDDCIHCADFMEMDRLDRHIVDRGFGFTEQFEGPNRGFASCLGKVRFADDLADGGERTAVAVFSVARSWRRSMPRLYMWMAVGMGLVMMGMGVIVAVFRIFVMTMRLRFFSSQQHVHFGCGDAAAVNAGDAQLSAEVERRYRALQEFVTDSSVQQGSQEHVPADSGKAFEICNTHRLSC